MAIVAIIVVGSYVAYKNGVFADTTSTTCQYTLNQMIPAGNYNNVYLTDSASANLVLQNPSTTDFKYLKMLHNVGDSYTSATAQTLFAVGHKADGTATISGGMDCIPPTRVGNFYISANLPTAVITTSFVANASTGTTPSNPTTTECMNYPIGSTTYFLFTYNSATQNYIDATGNRIVGINSLPQHTIDNTKCTSTPGNNTDGAGGDGPYCVTHTSTGSATTVATYNKTGTRYTKITGADAAAAQTLDTGQLATPGFSITSGVCSQTTTPSLAGADTVGGTPASSLTLKCIRDTNINDPISSVYRWYYQDNAGTWQQYSSPGTKYDLVNLRVATDETSCPQPKPTQALADSATGQTTTPSLAAAATQIWKCHQYSNASKSTGWIYKNKSGKWIDGDKLEVTPNIVSDSECNTKPTTIPADADTATSAASTDAPTWKCLVRTLLVAQWYYLNQNNKWESQDHSQIINSLTESGVGTGVCTTAQPTGAAPANAQTGPTSIGGNVQNQQVQAPVGPSSGSTATVYPNKISFTASRVSYAETNRVVPMGGVSFTVRTLSSFFAGNVTSSSNLPTTNSNGTTVASQAKCSSLNTAFTSIAGLFNSNYSKSFTTPDSGSTANFTQTSNVPPGNYEVSFRKNGFGNNSQNICFQVGSNDGVSTPIQINALLFAQDGAEPPGFTKNNTLWYDDTVNSQQEYKTSVLGTKYKYMPHYPWYGWQIDNGSYITGAPNSTTPDGLPAPGVSANYGTPANLQQALSTCQNYGISLGDINKSSLPWLGAAIGAFSGLTSNSGLSGTAGRTLGGAAIGYLLGQSSGTSATNISINIGQLNAQCQSLYNQAIPAQCQSCFVGNVYNQNSCPQSCVPNIPFYQSLLQNPNLGTGSGTGMTFNF